MVVDMDGSGTEQDPYLITTVEELQAINEELDAHYELANGINAEETRKWNNGDGFNPIGLFTGTFDGNNYEIRNLCIKQPDQSFIGMFGSVSGKGRVENLGLISPRIEGKDDVGSLAGENMGEIVCSYVKGGHISGEINIGGLIGRNYGIVESSYTVKSNISGHRGVGGLVAHNHTGRVESSYTVKVDVSGDGKVGGLAGSNDEQVQLSYTVKADISGDRYVGGLFGWNSSEPSDSLFILSSTDKTNILEDADLVLSRGNHTISYFVETRILYLKIDGDEIYSKEGLSPIKVQSLLEDTEVVEITKEFKTSVVTAT